MALPLAWHAMYPAIRHDAPDAPDDDHGGAAMLSLFTDYLANDTHERAAVAGLDFRGRLLSFAETAGSRSEIESVLPIFRSVLAERSVTDILIAHSHPFTTAVASAQDRLTTQRLSALARLAGTLLLDHFIFGTDGVYSIRQQRFMSQVCAAKS
jgi:DNA repair protein RadC